MSLAKIARQKGSILLSKTYHNSHTPLQRQCKHGHIWMSTAGNVKNKHWSPFCAGTIKLTIEQMHVLAAERARDTAVPLVIGHCSAIEGIADCCTDRTGNFH